jgi:hypothetical protein
LALSLGVASPALAAWTPLNTHQAFEVLADVNGILDELVTQTEPDVELDEVLKSESNADGIGDEPGFLAFERLAFTPSDEDGIQITQVTQQVSEPVTLALLVLVLAGLGWSRRKRA